MEREFRTDLEWRRWDARVDAAVALACLAWIWWWAGR